MSQAAALLSSLSGEDVTTYAANTTEEHIVIGDDRVIRIPDSLKRLAVQYDHDIETVTFDCPRYWDKHDMSQMIIYINYLLPNGTKGQYCAKNVTAVGRTMSFDWTISSNVTQYKGDISFLVCVKKTDADGNEELHWNSELNQEAYVSEGLGCTQVALTRYPDIITHLLTRMEEVEAIATPEAMQMYTDTWLEENHARILAEIEAKGAATLATIPEDYTETYNMAKESVRTKGDAIVCSAQGEMITVSDSSDDHIRNLRVFGKTTQVTTTGTNLFNPYAEQNNSFGNATVENNGARITVSGTYYVSWPLILKAGVTYYINFETVGDAPNRAIRFEYPDKEITGTVTNPASFTPTKDTVSVYLYAGLGTEDTIIYENIQISEGSSAIPWEPYSDGAASPSPDWPQPIVSIEKPTIDVYGKNLAVQNYALDYTTKGMRIATLDNASEVLLNGTADSLFSHTVLRTNILPPGTYTVSATGVNKHDDGHDRLYIADYYTGRVYANYLRDGSPKVITLPEHTRLRIDMVFKAGTVYNNNTLKIQIEPGVSNTEYEQCKAVQSVSADRSISGIPVTSGGNYTDANGQQWICDEIDFERAVYIQRISEVVIDGTVDLTVFSPGTNGGSAFGFNYAYIGMDDILRDRCPKLCDRLLPMPDVTIASWKLCEIGHWGFNTDGSADNFLIMNVGEFESAEAVQTWLKSNPITFQYILQTPIETPLTAEELEAFKALKTNYPNTTVLNDAGACMELSYNADTKTYVDNGIKQTVTDVMEAIANGSY